jgi:hypothetical protein
MDALPVPDLQDQDDELPLLKGERSEILPAYRTGR